MTDCFKLNTCFSYFGLVFLLGQARGKVFEQSWKSATASTQTDCDYNIGFISENQDTLIHRTYYNQKILLLIASCIALY